MRWLVAGIVSGIIIYLAEAVANTFVLGHDWKLWAAFVTRVFALPDEGLSLTMWPAGSAGGTDGDVRLCSNT